MKKLKYIYNNLSLTYGIFIILFYFAGLMVCDNFPFDSSWQYGPIEINSALLSLIQNLTFLFFFIGMLMLEERYNFCFKNKITNNFIYKIISLIIILLFFLRMSVTFILCLDSIVLRIFYTGASS